MNRVPPRARNSIRIGSSSRIASSRLGPSISIGNVSIKPRKSTCVECKAETSNGPLCKSCQAKQRFSLKPSDMFSNLSSLVIGQDHVKRILSVAAVSHLHRVRANQRLKQLKAIEEELRRESLQSKPVDQAFEEASQLMNDKKQIEMMRRKVVAVKTTPDDPGSFAVRHQESSFAAVEEEEPEEFAPVSEYDERLQVSKAFNVRNFDKGNILILGPTGSGKTLMAKTLAEITQGPLAICDATSLTAAGYVGDDVESILYKLLEMVQWDVSKAEQGIVYLDEIDKIAKRVSTRHAKDVGGESVQHGLLKMLEGSKINISKKGSAHATTVTVDTSNILFICAGAFTGIDTIVAKRTMTRSLGFGNSVAATYDGGNSMDQERDRLFQKVEPADLIEFGMIPEFIGRFSSIVSTRMLTEQDLIRILVEPQNAIINQMKSLFMIAFPKAVHLVFTDPALAAIAKIALSRGTGARGLKIVVEKLLNDCLFDLPERPWVTHVVVDEKVVQGKSRCLEMTPKDFEVWCESNPQYRNVPFSMATPDAIPQKIRSVA